MHWVDRGPEPNQLLQIRIAYTEGWVQYYQDGVGSSPNDSRWQEFRHDMQRIFQFLCAYCEEYCEGEVDHFRPKSRFPQLVYEWFNWLNACHECNLAKGSKWPEEGYADPCSASWQERPERFFTFETVNGFMIPLKDLEPSQRIKAQRMIDDLKLNDRHHLKNRKQQLYALHLLLAQEPARRREILEKVWERLATRDKALSSLTRTWLLKQGYTKNVRFGEPD